MRLTRLEIENFKGIGERQVVEIRPITLLYGSNSAGKTTILQAVEYLMLRMFWVNKRPTHSFEVWKLM